MIQHPKGPNIRHDDKSMYLTKGSSSGLKNLQGTKVKRTFCDGRVEAERVVIKASEIETKTDIHPLNPRNQYALTMESVRDIFESIQVRGVDTEGIAVLCPDTKKYLLADSSRRRFCCIEGNKDLPLWVLSMPVSDADILEIIKDSQKTKRWSYREEGLTYLKVKNERGLKKIEELAEVLNIGRETLRKKLQAAEINHLLLEQFPDYEGIPNTFYKALARSEKTIDKAGLEVKEFVKQLKKKLPSLSGDTERDQSKVLQTIVSFSDSLLNGAQKPEWDVSDIIKFDDKKKYAKKKTSPDGNVVKYEFSRLNSEMMKEIDKLIAAQLKNK